MTTLVQAPQQRLDPVRWPDVAHLPAGVKGRGAPVAWALFRLACRRLPLRVVTADGVRFGGGRDSAAPLLTVHRPTEFATRLAAGGLIGFGESYLAGDWDADDLAGVLTVFAARAETLVPAPLQALRRAYVARQPRRLRSTRAQARLNVAHHYDLSNELFASFLDETLSYSAGLFPTPLAAVSVDLAGDEPTSAGGRRPGVDRVDGRGRGGAGTSRRTTDAVLVAAPPSATDTDLAAAQRAKIDRILDLAGVCAGTRLLEIGSGWGELAIRAAQRGATVVTATLSVQQQELARQRVAAAGVADRVDVELVDYRSLHGTFDAVVSVEMIEAVGRDFWPDYFQTIDRLLAPGGKVALQAITMSHHRMLATADTHTWILKYIFPGGLLPSVRAIDEVTREHTRLRLRSRLSFGSHYAHTLRLWEERFGAQADAVAGLGFDDVFRRMWHFYLAYSRAGFAARYIDVQQLLLQRED